MFCPFVYVSDCAVIVRASNASDATTAAAAHAILSVFLIAAISVLI